MATRADLLSPRKCLRVSRFRDSAIIIIMFILIIGALVLPPSPTLVSGEEDPGDCEGKPTAYVLIGDISGPQSMQDGYQNAANEAVSDFLQAGYNVVNINHANVQDVLDALNDPCIKALMIIGHGGGETKFQVVIPGVPYFGDVPITVPQGIESIKMNDGWITGDPNMAKPPIRDTLLPSNPNVHSFYVHSCLQDLPSWRSLFPNMQEFYGWNVKCYSWWLFWWQWKHWPTPAEELLIGQVTGSPSLPELAGTYPYVLESEYAEYARTNFSDIMAIPPQTQLWSISPETLTLISDLSVNFYATSDDGLEHLHLFGLTTTDAEATMVGKVLNGPYGEVFFKNSALMSIMVNPSNFVFAMHAGDIVAAGDYLLSESEITALGAMVFGPEVMEPRVQLIDVFNPSSLLARTGLITASLRSTGAASGLIARLSLTSHLGVPITIDIGNSGLEGMVLVNPNENEQDEIITGIPGVFLSPIYRPTSEVTINPGENVTLPVIGYCINYDKDNPSDGTEFSLDNVSTKTDITSILEILDILENTTFPEDLTDDQILHVKQLAIWSILQENSEITRGDYAERGYSIPDESIQIIKDIYAQAQEHDASDAYIFQEARAQEGEASFSLDEVILNPNSLPEGKTVTITGKCTNTGTLSGSNTISLEVDDEIVDEKTVTLGPGESTAITFEITATGEGKHTIIIDGYTGSYIVKKASIMDQIPGFPHESIIIGLVISVITIWLLRMQKYG